MEHQERKKRPSPTLRSLVLGAVFLAGAAGAAVVANQDFRAADATRSLATAGSPDASEVLRARALAATDAALEPGAPSAELDELAASRALLESPANLDAAEAFTREALRRSPARASSWTRLAYIDAARDGDLGPEGLAALARSYEVQPFAPEALLQWRVEFTLSRWEEVGETLQTATLAEVRAATAGGARWYENSVWAWSLADRLSPEASAALLEVTPPRPF